MKNDLDTLSAFNLLKHNVSFLDRYIRFDEKWVLHDDRRRSTKQLNRYKTQLCSTSQSRSTSKQSRTDPTVMTDRVRMIRQKTTSCLSKNSSICVKLASVTQKETFCCISITTTELFEKERKLRHDSNATQLARVILNVECRRASQKNLHWHRKNKLLKSVQKRSSLKKYDWNLCVYSVSLSALMNEIGNTRTSRHHMELIAEKS
ncbi:hypothetical protein KIN20_017766 [Parelaphostrongylus tenuis]|uniref:Uncharacterized protein n=1 Tax=Parelaphostrongylus tenuis TaxID=148309 RepID=A0AAD5N0B6_PARTN|nr:hypothetical protein KIN20_017766 [Parelaphostrongylus tenuis]